MSGSPPSGARATLDTNFRSRPEILDVINGVFEAQLGDQFRPLRAGRPDAPDVGEGPRVELLVADKGADWAMEGLGAPWRVAEARALAARVGRLLADGTAARDVVLLTRATTDLRVYERALEDRGIPTYVIGGRGYWAHPQVIDMVCYLEAIANPRAEEALFTVLASPLVGVSADALVVLAATARDRKRDPWSVLRDPDGAFDRAWDWRIGICWRRFADWFAIEREVAARAGVEQLIDRALERTGYDLTVLGMPGGQRRLANVRKLMRLAREHEAAHGPGLRAFLDLVARRVRGGSASESGDARESEAPVEGEALDAVRLMTIHRAKGLEFDVVCVADLGRGPRWRAELMRVGRDGRFGLRLAEPGTGRRESALDYKALGEERVATESREERRLFYVAMTRARERLILSGAAKLDAWPALENGGGGGPIAWIGPAVEPLDGVAVTFVRPEDVPAVRAGSRDRWRRRSSVPLAPVRGRLAARRRRRRASCHRAPAPVATAPPVSALSYSSLAEYERCGYRFYAERVLRLPPPRGATARGARGRTNNGRAQRARSRHARPRAARAARLSPPGTPDRGVIAEAAAALGAASRARGDDAAQVAELVERFAARRGVRAARARDRRSARGALPVPARRRRGRRARSAACST